MRPLIAIVGVSVFVATLALAATTAPRGGQGAAAAATAAPRATADPLATSLIAPAGMYGRVAPDDRVDRTRRIVSGLAIPIEGASLPTDPQLLPDAPREFRGGWHEGIDFAAAEGTPVRAVAAGVIVRIDHDFTDWSAEEQDLALRAAVELGYSPPATLDRIRGRQIWIDHGSGIVSRYAHLSSVADLRLGAVVERGQIVGTVGSSGYPEGGPHLHLEVRLGASYLGDGLVPDALTAVIAAAFAAP